MTGSAVLSATLRASENRKEFYGRSTQHITGTADVNGDGKSDVIFTSDAGDHLVWEMNGTQVLVNQLIGPNAPPAQPPQGALAATSAAASGAEITDAGSAGLIDLADHSGGIRGADPHALWFVHDGHSLL